MAHVCNNRREQKVWIILIEFEKNFEDAVFAMTKQYKLSWVATRNLAAQLTSDGTPCTCDKNAFSFERHANCLIVDVYMLAAQKVGNIHFAQTIDANPATDQFIDPRHGARCDSPGATDVIDLP